MTKRLFLFVIVATMMVGTVQAVESAPDAAEYNDIVRTTVNAYIRFLPRYYGEVMFRGITSAPVANNTPRSPLGQIGYRDSSGWHSLPSIDGYPPLRAIAVASNGEVGAINESQYYHYSALAGGWTGPQDFGAPEMPGWIENAVLAFDNHDIPHIVGRYDEGGGVVGVAFDFDIRTGKWVMSNLPLSDNVNGILPIASDGQGTVGTAYVSNGQLIYARNVDNSGWEAFVLPTGGGEIPIPSPTGVGLAYDYEGIPVIAYSANQSLWLAYDPVVVPEPLTVTMLAIGGLVLCRRRRG